VDQVNIHLQLQDLTKQEPQTKNIEKVLKLCPMAKKNIQNPKQIKPKPI